MIGVVIGGCFHLDHRYGRGGQNRKYCHILYHCQEFHSTLCYHCIYSNLNYAFHNLYYNASSSVASFTTTSHMHQPPKILEYTKSYFH